jgi:thiosulfate dehydrogenase [quinone] large subunit
MKKNFYDKKLIVTLFRAAIGWHFLYEGLVKLWNKNWSAESYLLNATGPFAAFYH